MLKPFGSAGKSGGESEFQYIGKHTAGASHSAGRERAREREREREREQYSETMRSRGEWNAHRMDNLWKKS